MDFDKKLKIQTKKFLKRMQRNGIPKKRKLHKKVQRASPRHRPQLIITNNAMDIPIILPHNMPGVSNKVADIHKEQEYKIE